MYGVTIILHSWLRYVVLGFGVWLLVLAFRGRRSAGTWTENDERVQRMFMASLNVQFLLGLVLYAWLSPITQAAFADMGAAMKNGGLRFFAVEHLLLMVIAVAIAHIGKARAKRRTGADRYRTTFRMTLGWLVLTLLAIPWPWMQAGRPWFRL